MTPDQIHDDLRDPARWFTEVVRSSLGDNLVAVAVYGPAVTKIFDPREHRIHVLIVTESRDVDGLLRLAEHHRTATKRMIAPPLVTTAKAMAKSRDVFPLEWLDIAHYHVVVHGELSLACDQFDPRHVRMQCERDLRSLDIQLQRGILASGGKPRRIDRLEREAADTLIRVMRGIAHLGGDRMEHLPEEVCDVCGRVTGLDLRGTRQAIAIGGRHDLETCRWLVQEIAALAEWVDSFKVSA